jgi:hypothetical protein
MTVPCKINAFIRVDFGTHILLFAFVLLFFTQTSYSQADSPKEAIRSFAARQLNQSRQRKAEAIRMALTNRWPVRHTLPGGGVMEIMVLGRNGRPEYNITDNVNAAISSGTNKLWPDSASGLDLDGSGFLIGEWDGGRVRRLHQEFNNGSGSRVTLVDAATGLNDHSTHVAGTLIAEGQDGDAHGMAPAALLHAYEWNDDLSEMATAYADDDLILSNHSYGRIRGWYYNSTEDNWYWYGDIDISATEDYEFGFYGDLAVTWDSLACECPYYLIVKSAGNDRDDDYSGDHFVWYNDGWFPSNATRDPDGGTDGYDCIGNRSVAKNILTVGAVKEIEGGYSSPSDVTVTLFTSWGPTDDGRIKPDIVADGGALYSCFSTSNSAYGIYGGTSMASPVACGSMALLQDYYHSLHGNYMRSSVLKALVINTAFEAGSFDGPDYRHGWGLLNSVGAAQAITQDALSDDLILVNYLFNGETETYTYYSKGDTSINVTICWTDPPGTPVAPSLNPGTLMLVHDLDLRIIQTGSSTYYPWVKDPANPSLAATTGDNFRDNVEKITIGTPSPGEYTLQINHKSTIAGQYYGLIISGLTSVRPTNYWTGAVGTTWNNPSNWSLNHEPVGTEHAVIPAGCPDYPIMTGHLGIGYPSGFDGTCYTMTIENGASLFLQNMDVHVKGELNVEGNLHIGDDLTLHDGSTLRVAATANIYTGYTGTNHGVMLLESGSTVLQTGGEIFSEEIHLSPGCQYSATSGYFHIYKQGSSSANQHIQIDDPDSYFYNFKIDTLVNTILYDCSEGLNVVNVARVSGSLSVEGQTIHASYMNVYGEIVLSSGLLDITQTGPLFNNNSSLVMSGGELITFNSIWFLNGSSTDITGGTLHIRRDLHNTAGEFSAAGGKVRFFGNQQSIINGQTTFHKMEVSKDPGFKVYAPFNVSVMDSLITTSGWLEIDGATLHVGSGR